MDSWDPQAEFAPECVGLNGLGFGPGFRVLGLWLPGAYSSPPSVFGLLDFKLNSSPRPERFSSPGTLLLPRSTPRDSLECLECLTRKLECHLECPTPESPWSAQPQRLPEMPNPSPNPKGGDVRSKRFFKELLGALL